MDITGIGSIAELATSVINKFWPDKTEVEKQQLQAEMQEMLLQAQALQSQTDINKVEAASTSLWVAGWRPGIGWVCGVGFGIQVLGPLLEWFATLSGHAVKFPVMDPSLIGSTLAALLGLGSMRTVEKVKGINAGH